MDTVEAVAHLEILRLNVENMDSVIDKINVNLGFSQQMSRSVSECRPPVAEAIEVVLLDLVQLHGAGLMDEVRKRIYYVESSGGWSPLYATSEQKAIRRALELFKEVEIIYQEVPGADDDADMRVIYENGMEV